MSFNGATSRRTWRDEWDLQMGLGVQASMGPRPEGHGEPNIASTTADTLAASMGPRPEGHGELKNKIYSTCPYKASMGPRPEGHGEFYGRWKEQRRSLSLQWGHVQKDMERNPSVASSFLTAVGFNGATSRRTWRGAKTSNPITAPITLQWGHVQKDMERIKGLTECPPGYDLLQWGHVQKDMERARVAQRESKNGFASMGPRPEGHGEVVKWSLHHPDDIKASMGPRPEGHGEVNVLGHPGTFDLYRFNGATSRRTWRE